MIEAAKDIERFWSKVNKGAPGGCWEWIGSCDNFGYGEFRIGRRTRKAHRLSWALIHGEIPAGLCACHKCDNPPCVNPTHLFLGTKMDNTADMIRKGRADFSYHISKTRCKFGHAFTPENTYVYEWPNGKKNRQCRECHRLREVRRREKLPHILSREISSIV